MYLQKTKKLGNGFLIVKHHTAAFAVRNLLFGYEDIIAEFVARFSVVNALKRPTLNLILTIGKS